MKYMWSYNQGVQSYVNMQSVNDNFVNSTDDNLQTMDNLHKSRCKKPRRFRSAFTTDQVEYLEKQFKKFPYVGNAGRQHLAVALNIPERAIKIWFQNRRMREKKDKTNKEFDDEQTNRKSQEFPKDQLNNGTAPSANDQRYSLPLLTDSYKASCDNIVMNNSSYMSAGILVKDSKLKVAESKPPVNINHEPTDIIKPGYLISPTNYSKSADFSIDLGKKYKTKTVTVPVSCDPVPEISVKKPKEIKQEAKPTNYKFVEQIVPEDLSACRKAVPMVTQPQVPTTPTNPGYISVVPTISPLYAQPYYTANGVIWKPVNVPLNVMPTTTTPGMSIPVSVSNSLGAMSTVHENVPNKCCCNCHVKPQVPYNFQQQNSSPQYIITAVQFPNPSDAWPKTT